ncbi:MAG: hypothetical protein JOY94_05280 [Methylobacteriaceae bacterium]|nr:hypothetical protein [Methylobacteriaceae bacterium]
MTHSLFDLFIAYNGLVSVLANITVSAVLSLLVPNTARDATAREDYEGGASVHAAPVRGVAVAARS